jgi:hypothetical protein
VQSDSRPVAPPFTWVTLLGSVVLGVAVGAVGTVMHRSMRPWGVVLCLVLVAAAALTARAWGGLRAWLGYALAATATAWVLSTQGPGGDVLVPAHQAIGWVWLLGVPVVSLIVAALPKALFDDRPRPPRGGAATPPARQRPVADPAVPPDRQFPPYPGGPGPVTPPRSPESDA